MSYKTTREFTFKKDTLSEIGTNILTAVFGDEEISVDNLSISLYQSLQIVSIENGLSQKLDNRTINITLSNEITQTDLPSIFHLRNKANATMEVSTTNCTLLSSNTIRPTPSS